MHILIDQIEKAAIKLLKFLLKYSSNYLILYGIYCIIYHEVDVKFHRVSASPII